MKILLFMSLCYVTASEHYGLCNYGKSAELHQMASKIRSVCKMAAANVYNEMGSLSQHDNYNRFNGVSLLPVFGECNYFIEKRSKSNDKLCRKCYEMICNNPYLVPLLKRNKNNKVDCFINANADNLLLCNLKNLCHTKDYQSLINTSLEMNKSYDGKRELYLMLGDGNITIYKWDVDQSVNHPNDELYFKFDKGKFRELRAILESNDVTEVFKRLDYFANKYCYDEGTISSIPESEKREEISEEIQEDHFLSNDAVAPRSNNGNILAGSENCRDTGIRDDNIIHNINGGAVLSPSANNKRINERIITSKNNKAASSSVQGIRPNKSPSISTPSMKGKIIPNNKVDNASNNNKDVSTIGQSAANHMNDPTADLKDSCNIEVCIDKTSNPIINPTPGSSSESAIDPATDPKEAQLGENASIKTEKTADDVDSINDLVQKNESQNVYLEKPSKNWKKVFFILFLLGIIIVIIVAGYKRIN